MPTPALPMRSVHLDFHTGPAIPDVGTEFKPEEFAQTFVRARVQSVTLSAKCHHGHLYYGTTRPERHPHLRPGLDLLDAQISALHAVGIRAPVYLSVQVDEYAANQHPEWLALDAGGCPVKRPPGRFTAGWQVLDMSGPYQDYLADQIDDLLNHLGTVDGVFLDMCWDQPSTSRWAVAGMRGAGLDPADPADRDSYARLVAHYYMGRYRDMVRPHLSDGAATSIWFNSRPKTALMEEVKFVDHAEIEALPTGGWGYSYLPYVARFVRRLGVPVLAHTGRFHKSWGDNGGLKAPAALKYECCQMLAHGLAAEVGDLLHPRGRPAPAVYSLIGRAFGYLERCEPHLAGGKLVTEVAVLMDPDLGDDPGPAGVGVVRALQRLRMQFDVLSPGSDLTGYRLIVIPELTRLCPEHVVGLAAFLAGDGALLVSGGAAADGAGGPLLPEMGIEAIAPPSFSHTFLSDAANPGGFAHVMYEPSLRLTPGPGAETLYHLVDPYFERSWDAFSGHDYTPAGPSTAYAAILACGRTVTIAAPIFTAVGRHAAEAYTELLARCIDRLLPEPLLRTSGPAHLETSVVDTPASRVVHLLSFLPSRRAEGISPLSGQNEGIDLVTDAFPLIDVEVSVRLDEAPSRVTLQPHGTPLRWEYDRQRDGGRLRTTVSIPDGHAMIVIER